MSASTSVKPSKSLEEFRLQHIAFYFESNLRPITVYCKDIYVNTSGAKHLTAFGKAFKF